MIQITLNFTSVEAARAALLEIPMSAFAGAAPVAEKAAPSGKPKAEKAAVTQPATETAPTATATPASAPSASDSGVDYAVLQKAVFTLAGKNREGAAAVAASFGVKTFKELSEDKWAEALAAVNAKLAEV